MRVLVNLLAQRSWPTGTARYALNLVRALIDSNPGDEEYVVLVTKENQDFFRELVERSRGLLCRARSGVPWRRVLYEQFVLPGKVRKLAADILFTPYVAVPLHCAAARVTTIPDLIFLDHPYREGAARRIYLNRMVRWAAGHSEAVLTVSETTSSGIAGRLGTDRAKVFVTPNAVDPGLLELKDGKIEEPAAPFFLYVGNAQPGKNIELLLQAFKKLPATGERRIGLTLAGPRGRELGILRGRLAELELEGSVSLEGPVSDGRLAELYRTALALIMPSREEGFGVPCLEAMAFACPVLCSDIPVFRELYDGAALFFDPDDAAGLAGLMDRTSGDQPEKKEMIDRGLQRAEKFSWEASARSARAAFRHALRYPAAGGAS